MGRTREVAHLAIAFTLAFTFFACAKKAKPDADASTSIPSGTGDTTQARDSDSGNAAGLATIHFPFDSSSIESSEKEALKGDAAILKNNLGLHVQIEGHCDQRGGIQYNLALGERRANAVRKYLTGLGIAGSRITTISMGKEKPLDPADTEAAYAKNRRANFVLTD